MVGLLVQLQYVLLLCVLLWYGDVDMVWYDVGQDVEFCGVGGCDEVFQVFCVVVVGVDVFVIDDVVFVV